MAADALSLFSSLATPVGRDKILRLLHHFAQFYSWYLSRINGTPVSLAAWDSVQKQSAIGLKILHFGNFVLPLKEAMAAATAVKDGVTILNYASICKQLGYAGFLALDAATLLNAAGIKTWVKAVVIQREAFRFWAIGVFFSIVEQLYILSQLRRGCEGTIKSKHISSACPATTRQLLCDLCDMVVSTSALGSLKVNQGLVGLLGTFSCALNIYSYAKTTNTQ